MARILIIDDEHANAHALSLVLGCAGHQVSLANNGETALAKLDQVKPDLILTDYMMPRMNGAELAKSVRGSDLHAGVKILLMSGALEESLAEARPYYDAFLRKPFDIDVLFDQVHRLLDTH